MPHRAIRFAGELEQEGGLADAGSPLIVRHDDARLTPFTDSMYEATDYYSISITVRGTCTQVLNGTTCEAARGDVYIVPLGSRYASAAAENYVAYSVVFTMDVFDKVTLALLRQTPGFHAFVLSGAGLGSGTLGGRILHLSPAEFERIESLFDGMFAEYARGTGDGRLMTRLKFFEVLVALARVYDKRTASDSDGKAIEKHSSSAITETVRFIDENFANDIRIRAIAASCFLSQNTFERHFLEQVGRTPRDYITYVRIENAKRMLTATDQPVSEIGWLSGYRDAAYFVRAFRVATGTTPGKYRRDNTPPLRAPSSSQLSQFQMGAPPER